MHGNSERKVPRNSSAARKASLVRELAARCHAIHALSAQNLHTTMTKVTDQEG